MAKLKMKKKDNGKWYGYFYYHDEIKNKFIPKWVSSGLDVKGNKTKATQICEEKMNKFLEDLSKQKQIKDKNILDYTIWEYADRYLNTKTDIRANTKRGYISIRNVLKSYFNNKKIKDIDKTQILEFYNHLRSLNLTENTISHYSKFLSPLFDFAIKENVYNLKNPAKYKKFDAETYDLKIEIPKRKVKVLEPNKQKDLLYLIKNSQHDFFRKLEVPYLLSIYTGIRRGELCALEITDFDFSINLLTISKSLDYKKEDNKIINDPKGKEIREIYLPESIMQIIKNYVNNQDQSLWEEQYKTIQIPYNLQKQTGTMNFNPIFRHANGSLITPSYISHTFAKLIKKENFKPYVVWHDLRHTCATNLIDMGFNLYEVQKYLGHQFIETTERFYATIFTAKQKKNAEKIGSALDNRFNIENQ